MGGSKGTTKLRWYSGRCAKGSLSPRCHCWVTMATIAVPMKSTWTNSWATSASRPETKAASVVKCGALSPEMAMNRIAAGAAAYIANSSGDEKGFERALDTVFQEGIFLSAPSCAQLPV